MKRWRFRCLIRNKGGKVSWNETFTRETDNIPKEAAVIVAFFNSTLREGEQERELVKIKWARRLSPRYDHRWEKQNLVTLSKGNSFFDILRCEKCGATAKRFGLVDITVDAKFAGKTCVAPKGSSI